MQLKKKLSNCTKRAAVAVSLFLLQLSFAFNPALYFNIRKKLLWQAIMTYILLHFLSPVLQETS